jgi:hypothetical protein
VFSSRYRLNYIKKELDELWASTAQTGTQHNLMKEDILSLLCALFYSRGKNFVFLLASLLATLLPCAIHMQSQDAEWSGVERFTGVRRVLTYLNVNRWTQRRSRLHDNTVSTVHVKCVPCLHATKQHGLEDRGYGPCECAEQVVAES